MKNLTKSRNPIIKSSILVSLVIFLLIGFVGCSFLSDVFGGSYEEIIVDEASEIFVCDGYKYCVNSDGKTCTIVGLTYDCDNLSHYDIPSKLNGYTVAVIGDYAFACCGANFKSVDIPSTVKTIGYKAFFSCNNLRDVTFHEGLISIGEEAFSGSEHLNFKLPRSVKHIGKKAFIGSLSNKTYYGGGEYIGVGLNPYYALIYVSEIEGKSSFTVHKDTKVIADGLGYPKTFGNHPGITEIIVEEGNKNFKAIDGNLYSKDGKTLIAYAAGKSAESFTVPDGVVEIRDHAFGESYSYYEDLLKEIKIPSSVKKIGARAFNGCEGVERIDVDGQNNDFKSVDGVLYSKNGENLIRYPIGRAGESYVVLDGVTKINDYAFYNAALKEVKLPVGVSVIGASAFESSSVEKIDISSGLKKIGREAFRFGSLTEITLPDGLEYIGNSAFLGNAFSSVAIPDSVKRIGERAFLACYDLKTVKLPSGITEIEFGTFDSCPIDSFEIPDGVVSIGSGVVGLVKKIKIPRSVKFIDVGAFPSGRDYEYEIFYAGSEEEWKEIDIRYNKVYNWPENVKINFNCE